MSIERRWNRNEVIIIIISIIIISAVAECRAASWWNDQRHCVSRAEVTTTVDIGGTA